jgi:hypothetical protein
MTIELSSKDRLEHREPRPPVRRSSGEKDARRPVFVAGPDRSGTTLIFALLASHPELSMSRRTNMWRYFDRRYGDLSDPANLDRCLDDMTQFRRMRHLEPDRDRLRREFLDGPPTYGRLFSLFHLHHAQRAGKTRWGDKSLHTEHYVERLFQEFPDARVVYMLRDPRDRYASIRNRWGEDRSRVAGATGRWLQSLRAAQRGAERYADRYLIVRYEDLAADPDATMRAVCDFLELSFMPELLSMDGVPEMRDRGGNSSYGARAAGTISTSSIGRFRFVLPAPEVAFIERKVGAEMDTLGYGRADLHLTRGARLRFALWDMPVWTARMRVGMVLESLHRHRGERVPASKLNHQEEPDAGEADP